MKLNHLCCEDAKLPIVGFGVVYFDDSAIIWE